MHTIGIQGVTGRSIKATTNKCDQLQVSKPACSKSRTWKLWRPTERPCFVIVSSAKMSRPYVLKSRSSSSRLLLRRRTSKPALTEMDLGEEERRRLHDLWSLTGNDRCADCGARCEYRVIRNAFFCPSVEQRCMLHRLDFWDHAGVRSPEPS